MRRPNYELGIMIKAVKAGIEPEVYDDVVVWDDNGFSLVTGLLLKKSDTGYMVLAYYDEPQVFAWEHAAKIEV